MIRRALILIAVALPLAGSGCAIVEVGVRNPVAGLETVAVIPFFNLSQERTVDGREFALAYYAELQKVPGFEVLPVGVAERAMVENGLSMNGPGDAVHLAEILDVDAVVVGAVTDYDPYNPRLGLKVAWYSPRQWLFLANEPPARKLIENPLRRPKYTMSRAQSPDDFDPVGVTVEEGDWEAISTPQISNERLLASTAARSDSDHSVPFLVPVTPRKQQLVFESGEFIPVEWAQSRALQNPDKHSSGVVSAQATRPGTRPPAAPPGQFLPPLAAQPLTNADPERSASPLPSEPAFPAGEPDAPRRQPNTSETPGSSTTTDLFPSDNPFDPRRRNAAAPSTGELDRLVPEINGRSDSAGAPRIAAAQPELMTPPVPPSAQSTGRGESKELLPVVPTPLFPLPAEGPATVSPPLPRSTVPGLEYGDEILLAPEVFDSQEPLMAYVRLFDSTDRRLIARLSDYLELTGQMRSGDLQAYMKRSDFFRKFTAHVMISEMLTLHGGEARRQLILKSRKYR